MLSDTVIVGDPADRPLEFYRAVNAEPFRLTPRDCSNYEDIELVQIYMDVRQSVLIEIIPPPSKGF